MSQMAKVFAANWKMNIGPTEARSFLDEFLASYRPDPSRHVIFFPPAVSLPAVVERLAQHPEIGSGVQNIHPAPSGAFTGETSASLAHEAGASHVLVGHSERRLLFGETNEIALDKCRAALRAGLRPILCVGETREQRSAGKTAEVVHAQLSHVIDRLTPDEVATCMLAYEPVWAIGTGDTATPQDAEVVHAQARQLLDKAIGSAASGIPILYGGSVKPDNAAELLATSNVDGVLVGGASLKASSWLSIVTA